MVRTVQGVCRIRTREQGQLVSRARLRTTRWRRLDHSWLGCHCPTWARLRCATQQPSGLPHVWVYRVQRCTGSARGDLDHLALRSDSPALRSRCENGSHCNLCMVVHRQPRRCNVVLIRFLSSSHRHSTDDWNPACADRRDTRRCQVLFGLIRPEWAGRSISHPSLTTGVCSTIAAASTSGRAVIFACATSFWQYLEQCIGARQKAAVLNVEWWLSLTLRQLGQSLPSSALPVSTERRQDQSCDPHNHQKHERVAAMLVRVENNKAALIRRDPNYRKNKEG